MTSSPAQTCTDVGVIWDAALVRYEKTTNVKIQSLTGPKNVDEILSNIVERETKFACHRHDGSKVDKFRALVKRSLTPIEMWSDIVINATKTIYPPAEAIFAAARYLISTANAVSTDYDRIEEFFEALNSYLGQLRIWETKIPPIPELEEVITEVFVSVLVLCGICTKYVQTKRFVKAFRALAGEDMELKLAFDQFRKVVSKEQGIVRNAILAGVQDLKLGVDATKTDVEANSVVTRRIDSKLDNFSVHTRQIEQHLAAKETSLEREKILAWLSSLDFHQKQKDTFTGHYSGTGSWFVNAEGFTRWFEGGQNAILWCPGIPGAGKTVMISAAITFVEEKTEQEDIAIAYVYCDYKNPKTQSESELLSSIARQLAERLFPLPPEVKAYRDKWIEKRSYPTDEDWVSLVKDLSTFYSRTFIFVDALDECSEQNRDNFLCMVQKLEPFVRFLITSRPHLDLERKFTNLCRLDIVAHDSDIKIYLESEIDKNKRMSLFTAKDTSLKLQIIETVGKKADGMFLLAHFQMAHLCRQSSPKKIRESLNQLPTKIYVFYDEAFARIDDQSEADRDLAKRAITFIHCSKRPLDLEELRHALSVEEGDTELDRDALPWVEVLSDISAGLVHFNEKSNTATFVHYTLQEYLEKNTGKLGLQPEMEIAKVCLRYLSFDIFKSGPCNDERSLKQRLEAYRFLDYAAHHWGSHLLRNQLQEGMDSLFDFLQNEWMVASSVQVLYIPRHRMQGWYDQFPKQYSSVHVVAYWGLDKALDLLCEEGIDLNCQDSYGNSALQLAAKYGHLAVVQLLVKKGAAVDIRNKRGETAMYWAARAGHKIIVELLISYGADVTIEDSEGWTALDWAVIGGHVELAKLMLDFHDNNSEHDKRNKALILAAEAGTEATVRMLLDVGADVNWKDQVGSTALTWAVPGGHERVVRILLERGAHVNTRDDYGNTPLHWALPFEPIMKLLLENGADINAENDTGQSALMWSAQDGQEKALELLLEKGAHVNSKDIYGFTPLHAAALKGYENMARTLLENGAHLNEKDRDGWTPLHAAALKEHKQVVHLLLDKTSFSEQILRWIMLQQKNARENALLAQMAERKSQGSTVVSGLRSAAQDGHLERVQALLENGADIDEEDACGSTALTLATWLNEERIVRLLLEHGAKINKRERSGYSALHLASEDGNREMIQLLVRSGASVNAHIHGWTPMLIAAKRKQMWTVEYLIENGADVNAEDYHGRTALHWAAQWGEWMTMQKLRDKGANIDAADRWGRTALMLAVHCNELAAARLLLEMGASMEPKIQDGPTPLHLASYIGDKEIVSLLLQEGANLEAVTWKGFRSLHIAALMGHEEIVRLLLENNADVKPEIQSFETDIKDHNGYPDGIIGHTDDGTGMERIDADPEATEYVGEHLHQQLLKKLLQKNGVNCRTARQLAIKSGNMAVQRLFK